MLACFKEEGSGTVGSRRDSEDVTSKLNVHTVLDLRAIKAVWTTGLVLDDNREF